MSQEKSKKEEKENNISSLAEEILFKTSCKKCNVEGMFLIDNTCQDCWNYKTTVEGYCQNCGKFNNYLTNDLCWGCGWDWQRVATEHKQKYPYPNEPGKIVAKESEKQEEKASCRNSKHLEAVSLIRQSVKRNPSPPDLIKFKE